MITNQKSPTAFRGVVEPQTNYKFNKHINLQTPKSQARQGLCSDCQRNPSPPYPLFQGVFLHALVKALGADTIPVNRHRWRKLFWRAVAVKSSFIKISDDLSIQSEHYTPEHRQRYKLSADPDKRDAPIFFQYLSDTFSGDDCEQDVALLQQIMGGLVTGSFSKLQRAVLLIGPGSNGKSVFLELLEHMFPPKVKCAVSPNDFNHEYYRAELAGKVINIIGELDKTKSLQSAFKDVIGCDTPISARLPYKEPFSFKPSAGHIFASNHFPQTKDHTHGFYRRWVILSFKNTVEDNKKIPNLGTKIAEEEMPQVLSWALQGAERLAKNNFKLPLTTSHENALAKWKNTKDSVFCFLGDDDVVVNDPDFRTPKKEIYNAYRSWSNDMGVRSVGYHEFVERCKLKFQEVKRSGERRCFKGLRLTEYINTAKAY